MYCWQSLPGHDLPLENERLLLFLYFFHSLTVLKTFSSSSPILGISICCFYSNSLQLRDSMDLAVTACKVLIDTGFHIGRGRGLRWELEVMCIYVCVLGGEEWANRDSIRRGCICIDICTHFLYSCILRTDYQVLTHTCSDEVVYLVEAGVQTQVCVI